MSDNEYFESVKKKNDEKKKRMDEMRSKSNTGVLRSYRITSQDGNSDKKRPTTAPVSEQTESAKKEDKNNVIPLKKK